MNTISVMRAIPFRIIAAALLLFLPPALPSHAEMTKLLKPSPEVLALQQSFAALSEAVKPTVVNISAVLEDKSPNYEFYFISPFGEFFNGPGSRQQKSVKRKMEIEGSGVIISADGYILTNEHVVHGAESINVTLFDDKKYQGKIIGRDERTDVAIVKINAGKNRTYARLGDSTAIHVGEWVIAVGSPFGLEETVTAGIISANRQSVVVEGKVYSNLIQTDAAINRGNSGGPLFNMNGEVIGINTAIYAPTGAFSGVGFAIAINNAKEVLDALIRKGKVERGWIGIETHPVDAAIARQFGLKDVSGALVNRVFEDSPAQRAGLQRGDVITAFNGKEIKSSVDLQAVVSRAKPNTRVPIQVFRNGRKMVLQVTTGEMPSDDQLAALSENNTSGSANAGSWQGLTVLGVTPEIASRFNIPANEHGCLVINVESDSIGEAMGVRQGDIIRALNKIPTPTEKDFEKAAAQVKLSEGIVLDINRQGMLLYLSFTAK